MNRTEIIQIASEAAVKAAFEYQEKQNQKKSKSRHDKRLRNTKLLLKNYRLLKDHCENAVFDKKELIEISGVKIVDLLDSLDGYERSDYIESIKKSVSKTQVILAHIDAMMKIYRIYCEESDKPEDLRRYRIISSTYLENTKPDDICREEGIDQRTYYRDSRDGVEKLSSLIFGIDGLSDVSKRCQ
ncbi:hypothetical protein Ga0466249_005046 [Sporomusaceae bacterium BoRhaA]|uniref:hypothetical protein n=1 Tax=Pelorhabdus rhamnosifermentans TaxID=2772457 RepID=UPI001C062060|nr:hypothetical protein [Pelorhabdus rhamnosifermentans]MBU2703896.1 hypothetical protein [Pelorhabdus rhamnosifermentans]